jgi:GMP synthase-like glutamine amidotransferase
MNVLVFQHLACEHPGQLRRHLQEDGASWQTVQLDQGDPIPSLDDFDALWVMGGPMDVWQVDEYPWLVAEKDAIRRWVRELERPFLGVCLGHQLLADALGGECELQRKSEIGVLEIDLTDEGMQDSLFLGMQRRQKVLQWHSVNVVRTPAGARILASSEDCRIQAMRVGQYAWSIQYHVEAESDTVDNWGSIPQYRRALEKTAGPGALAALRTATRDALPAMFKTSDILFRNFRKEVDRALAK